jgi:hypothetical protein
LYSAQSCNLAGSFEFGTNAQFDPRHTARPQMNELAGLENDTIRLTVPGKM